MGQIRLILLSFICPATSFWLSLIISQMIAHQIHDEMITFTLSNSFYLAGLLFGSHLSKKYDLTLKSLLKIESFIFVTSYLSVLLISMGLSLTRSNLEMPIDKYFLMNYIFTFILVFNFSLGSLTAFEIPLFSKILGSFSEKGFQWSLLYNYLGSFFGGLFFFLFSTSSFSTLLMVNFICLGALGILFCLTEFKFKKILNVIFIFILLIPCTIYFDRFIRKIPYLDLYREYPFTFSQFFSETWLLSQNLEVQTFKSPYQEIEIIKSSDFLALYINHQYQFDSRFEKNYHDSFVLALPENYKSIPKEVLILGGGDGLLVRTLKDFFPQFKMTLVDIDPEVLNLAKTNPDFIKINENSMNSNLITVQEDDAFRFLKNSTKKWDLILGDLPYPFSLDLSKLYSVEFYSLIFNHLKTNGLFIFDHPLGEELSILKKTLSRTGFHHCQFLNRGEGFVRCSMEVNIKDSEMHSPFNSNFDWKDLPESEQAKENTLLHPTLPVIHL